MATAYGVEMTKLAVSQTSPRSVREVGSAGGKVRVFMDTISAATTDIDDDDIIMLAEIPSGAKIKSIKLYNDDMDSNGSPAIVTDLGIYNGNTAFSDTDGSATRYAAEGVIEAAVTAGTEFRNETLDINTVANYMWQDAGLTSDPGVQLWIALTIETVAATAAAGDITIVVEYIIA
jgi:hypothetical protein